MITVYWRRLAYPATSLEDVEMINAFQWTGDGVMDWHEVDVTELDSMAQLDELEDGEVIRAALDWFCSLAPR